MIFIGTKENQAADALSRIEINNLMFLQKKDLNYSNMVREQRRDEKIMRLFHQQDDNSSVIEEFKVSGTDDLLLCDTSTNHTRPLIPQNYRLKVFNSFHKLAYSGTETIV